ncbi:MAG: FecR domain-containing protein [Bacteroidota bacterium]|jgi:ferric-dicitrate binding protein FerR (iron transport regulator)
MIEDKFFRLVTKYVSKEASVEETDQLHSLLKQKKYADLFKSMSKKWEDAGERESLHSFNLERGFQLLTSKIHSYDSSFQWEKKIKPDHTLFYRFHSFRIAASIAALVFLVAGGLFVSHHLKQKSDVTAWNEKKTVMGEKVILTLLDGTKVTLNADSKLKYPVRFGEESREVSLQGEAYFEAAHDDTKPFIVHSGGVTTTDLGTKFNVKAFPDENNVTVSLEDGKVKVRAGTTETQKNTREILLAPTQQFVFDKENEISTVETFDLQKAIGWKDNILIFDNEPLSKVLVPLERYFGVKFEIANPALANRIVKANFKNESFWTVVTVMEKATGLTYKTDKDNNEIKKIVFYEK